MKKFLFCLFFIILMVSLHAEKIKLGSYSLVPYFMETGNDKKPGGSLVDYWVKYIAPKMGVELEIVGPLPALRVLKMLEDGEVDVIPLLTSNPDRQAKFLIAANPITEVTPCVVLLKENPLNKITKQEDLFNMRLGFLSGATVPAFLTHAKITIENVTDTDYRQVNLEKLTAKRLNGVFDLNLISLLYDVKVKGFKDKVKALPLPIDTVKAYAMFTKSDKGTRLLKLYDKVHGDLFKTPTFANLTKKYTD